MPPDGRRRAAVVLRTVRGAIELRVEGTLASVYRPGRSLTGVVWWALAAPVLFVPRRRPRVLLLGLGGGSVARALRVLDAEAEIVGVEREREVLRLARRHFGLDRLGVEVVQADALSYLRRERRAFDLIVEDLFVGPSRTVHKPDWLVEEGYPLVRRRLREDGLAVSNTIHELPAIVRACRPLGGRMVSLGVASHWNRILVCGRRLPPPAAIRARLAGVPALAPMLRRVSVRAVR